MRRASGIGCRAEDQRPALQAGEPGRSVSTYCSAAARWPLSCSRRTSRSDSMSLTEVRLEQLKGQRAAAEQYVEKLRSRLSLPADAALLFAPYSAKPKRGACRMTWPKIWCAR